MNQQTCYMLEKIVLSRKALPINEFAGALSVGSRTVLNYWKEIEEYLRREGLAEAVCFDGGRFTFSGGSAERQRIGRAVSHMDFYDYRLNSEERIWVISAHLCASSAPMKIEQMQALLSASRTTVSNDIKTVGIILEKRGISFHENKHMGIQMRCGEHQRRELILEIAQVLGVMRGFQNPDFAFSPFPLFFRRLFSSPGSEAEARNAIAQYEVQSRLHLLDRQYDELFFFLSLCVSAIEAGRRIASRERQPGPAREIAAALFQCMGTPLGDENEVDYLAEKIAEFGITGQEIAPQKSGSYIEFLTDSLLYALSFNYDVDFLSDSVLREYLTAHIRSCAHRVQNGISLENSLLQDVLQQYPADLRILKDHIYILEHGLNLSLGDDETAYILMHILTSLERKNLAACKPKLAVACNAGIGTGNLLAMLIRKNFDVIISSVCSIHQLDSVIRNSPVDLIVTTIPVQFADVPTVIVNAIPSDRNLQELRMKLAEIRDAKMRLTPILRHHSPAAWIPDAVTPVSLKSLLHPDCILLDTAAATWEEAIIAAGEPLLWKGCISVNYLNTMVSLIHRYGPYIVLAKGVALAHASPEDGMLLPGISLVRLREPVAFGHEDNDPIWAVFACAMPDKPAYTAALLNLMQKIRRPSFLQAILEAADREELMEVIGE